MTNERLTRYKISRHAALKRRAHGEVLVLPEQAIRLGGSGAEILHLCERPITAAEIESILCERYPEESGLGSEVDRFLREMVTLGGVDMEPGILSADATRP